MTNCQWLLLFNFALFISVSCRPLPRSESYSDSPTIVSDSNNNNGVPIDSDNDPVDSDNDPVDSDNDPVDSDNDPVESDNDPIESDNDPVESDNDPVESDNDPVKSDNDPVKSDNDPVEPVESDTMNGKPDSASDEPDTGDSGVLPPYQDSDSSSEDADGPDDGDNGEGDCQPFYRTECNDNGDVVSFDSCGNLEGVLQDCVDETNFGGCVDGSCKCTNNREGTDCNRCKPGWTGEDCSTCVIYVDSVEGTDLADGTSWSQSKATIQNAIDASVEHRCEVWVAAGTYYPTVKTGGTSARHKSIQMADGVNLYGGFKRDDQAFSDRNIEENVTILSGDADLDNTVVNNVFHVVRGANAAIDGFTIAGGNALGAEEDEDTCGGGLRNDSVSPTVSNCIFTNHFGGDVIGSGSGRGICNKAGANAYISNCKFINNDGKLHYCEGVAIYNSYSAPIIENSLFQSNSGSDANGGAINNFHSDAIIKNSIFRNNSADQGGAIYNRESQPVIENCQFWANKANGGSAIKNQTNTTVEIKNCIFFGNIGLNATSAGMVISNYIYSIFSATNCTFLGNMGGSRVFGEVATFDAYSECNFFNNIVWSSRADNGEDYFVHEHPERIDVSYNNIEAYCVPRLPCANNNISVIPEFNNVPKDFFYTSKVGTSNVLFVEGISDDHSLQEGDRIELDADGTLKTVVSVKEGYIVEITPALDHISEAGIHISNWGQREEHFDLDLTLNISSLCIDAANGLIAPLTDCTGRDRYDEPSIENTGLGDRIADIGAFEYTSTLSSQDE